MEHHALIPRGANAPIFMLGENTPPFITPSLTANLVIRILLGIVANLVCLVPLRLLYRNGEFAAVVFILVVETKNIFSILMAALWHTDDMESWWPGYGLCDVEPFVYNGCAGIYVTCLLAIMRNLAHQVGIMRANPLTVKEKRRRNLIQALIIFPLPIVQMAFTFPLASQRYAIGPLMGCSWVPYSAWPYLVFYVVAQLVISVVAAIYAGKSIVQFITFFRFRQVTKVTASALTSNRAAFLRSQRAKRRLYLMVMSILVPFLPITITLSFLNIQALGVLKPFDFNAIHHSPTAAIPWEAITFVPSRLIDFGSLNNGYISILTAIPIFLFFGMTKDAMNAYRVVLLYIGLGRVWPNLHNEYDPDRKAMQTAASAGYLTRITGKTKSSETSASRYRLTPHVTSKSVSSESTAGGHTLTRLLTPRLATSLGGGSERDSASTRPPSRWSNRLPRNPFPFRYKAASLHLDLESRISSHPPVLPPLDSKASVFSLHVQNDDEISVQPASPRFPNSPRHARNFSLPVIPQGQPHPSEALDLPNAFSILESSNRSATFAGSTAPETGDRHQRS